MSLNWGDLCRLCARNKLEKSELFFKVESIVDQIVQKFFLFSLLSYEGSSNSICQNCLSYIINLNKYSERCIKVNKMFSEIFYNNLNNMINDDINSYRFRFGIDDDDKFSELSSTILCRNTINVLGKLDKTTDTNDLFMDVIHVKEEPTRNEYTQLDTTLMSISSPDNNHHSEEIQEKIEDNLHNSIIDGLENLESQPILQATRRKKRGRPKKNDNDVNIKLENENHVVHSDTDIYNEDFMPDDKERMELTAELNELLEKTDSTPISKDLSKKQTRKNCELENITCPICEKCFDRRRKYEIHMATKHSSNTTDSTDTNFMCSKCPKFFPSEKKRKLHEAVHLPETLKMVHPCIYCDKKFSKAVNVQAHVRAIHIGDRPFICEECGKAFGTKGALKEHQITHSDERPYQCSYCPKKFKNLPRLKTHEDIHKDTIYVCPHCGIQLNTKRTLKMHMVVHSDQKKYKCHYCGNEYKRSKALKNHLILHTGLRPYTCPFCDKTFANGSNCRSHKKKAHPFELAAMEASGEIQRATNIPKLEHLQPKKYQMQELIDSVETQQNHVKNDEQELKHSINQRIVPCHTLVSNNGHNINNTIQYGTILNGLSPQLPADSVVLPNLNILSDNNSSLLVVPSNNII